MFLNWLLFVTWFISWAFWFVMLSNMGSTQGRVAAIMNPAAYRNFEQRASRHFWFGFACLAIALWRIWG